MERAGSLLPDVLRKRGLYAQASASRALFLAQAFLRELLPNIAHMLHPRSVRDGILCIEADCALAAQEAACLRDALLERLRAVPDPPPVSSIRILRSSGMPPAEPCAPRKA